ncbi:LutC/YkgG family protein [Pontivivens nitratireducens]|uniref:LUD domain-containing protein n=1 Tax=Pontivivens nitratireducens TaxID=2758038 RepID=A0A6G7VIL9_9RHOB|nr:lactate utilization protein [Pontibrevibacter nitratireducens]QIK39637.1 LUD domain-containing protein [Pontibrevibacter nitratireducens]
MSARDRILGRIRRVATGDDIVWQGGGATPAIARTSGADRVERFIAQATAADATVTRLDGLADLPAALAEELRNRNLPAAIRHGAEPDFAALDWGGVEASQGMGRIDEPATLSKARCAMAETGTLVLTSGPDNPVTLTFLGETHFVVVEADRIEAGFEGVFADLRAAGSSPRTVNMVTGPSRSADIGQVLQLGAHGPIALHIFVLGA